MTEELKRLEATVRGRVQGVYFRQTTRSQAQQLHLTGWTRNEPDGTVKVVAEGPEAALQQLLTFLHQGPPGARVDQVQANWSAATGDFATFHIRQL
jgi:acylphosphatase